MSKGQLQISGRNLTVSLSVAILSALPLVGGRTECSPGKGVDPDLVMTVGTNRLMQADFDAIVAFRTDNVAQGVIAKAGLAVAHDQVATGVRKAFGRRVLGEYLENRLFADYALGKGLKPNAKVRAEARKAVARYVRKTGDKNRKALDDFADMRAMAVSGIAAVLEDFRFEVSDASVSNAMKRISAYNAKIAATNALQATAATNLWRAASAPGADFVQLADAAQRENPEVDVDFGTDECDEDGLEDFGDGAKAAVAPLKVGEVAAPICADNGYLVLKLQSKRKEDDESRYKVLCVRFSQAIPAPGGTFQEVRASIMAEKVEEFRKEALRKLERTAGVRVYRQF